MKIIRKPEVSNWTYKYTCWNCDSELEVEPSDLIVNHYDGDMREPSYDAYTAICEVCSQAFAVPTEKIPKLIQIEAKKRSHHSGSGGYFER